MGHLRHNRRWGNDWAFSKGTDGVWTCHWTGTAALERPAMSLPFSSVVLTSINMKVGKSSFDFAQVVLFGYGYDSERDVGWLAVWLSCHLLAGLLVRISLCGVCGFVCCSLCGPVRNHTFMTCTTPIRKFGIAWPEPQEARSGRRYDVGTGKTCRKVSDDYHKMRVLCK